MVHIESHKSGFTLIELLVVLAIVSVLAAIVLGSVRKARERAYLSRQLSEFKVMATALEMYALDNGGAYPPDASRDIPPGLGAYLSGYQSATWPKAAWPGSVYDWEAWTDPANGSPIYQISVRFCPAGGPLSACQFPDQPWASNFNINSSYYYCVLGACRSHISEPINYPGYCANCGN